ncbi:hypothetical protein B0H14DRAFT_719710 [Mycena olivaceomarginata]|nr:hypothetical protein B0H14DRAFT_719710 [Mycena olivaceomarginata]
MRVLAVISATEHLAAITLGLFLFLLALGRGQGVWKAIDIETTVLVYGIIHVFILAMDPSGIKRRQSELARIARKYRWHKEESGTPTDREMLIGG